MQSKVDNFSVFSRMFIVYSLLVVTIYIVLVALFLSNINRSSDELISGKQMQNQNYLENVEMQLENMYTQQINMTSDQSVTRLAFAVYQDKYEKNLLIIDLMDNIKKIKSMTPYIEDIIITFPGQKMTLSALEGYSNQVAENWQNVTPGSAYNYLISYDGKLVLNFTYPLMYSESEDYVPDYNIQIILSNEMLDQSLEVFSDERGTGAALWFDLEEDFILESDDNAVVSQYLVTTGNTLNMETVNYKDYTLITASSETFPVKSIALVNQEAIVEVKLKYIYVLTVVMLIITAIFAFSLLYTKHIIVKPIKEMMSAFGKIQAGDFSVRIYHEPHDEFNYLYHGFNDTTAYIQELIANIYEQETLLQNAELAQLQSQINPHFLYNSFFIINRMAKNEAYEQITRFVTSLAKYYRFINKESKHFIPLVDEVEHMKNYMDIQQMRFSDKISVKLEDLPLDMHQVKVPKLILQPVVENAYNYGMANILEDGLIRISYHQEGHFVLIDIEDNGEDASDELVERMTTDLNRTTEEYGNHALANIHKRLELAYGDLCGLTIALSELGGIRISLKVDMRTDLS